MVFQEFLQETREKRARRSRWSREGARRIQLTERDIEIFKLLNRYRYLRSDFIHAFIGGDRARLIKRLNDLYRVPNCYLGRPEQQQQYANANYRPLICGLDQRGEEVLRAHGLLDYDSPLLRKGRAGAYRNFAHELMIGDILASIELGVRADLTLRFIPWQEILAKAPEKTRNAQNPFDIKIPSLSYTFPRSSKTHTARDSGIVPDALFGLEYTKDGKKSYRFFALEADRNSMPIVRNNLAQTSLLRKVLQYRQITAQQLYRSHFGLPNLIVLTVTTSERHMRNMMTFVRELAGSSTLFLFKTLPSLGNFERAPAPNPHMLTAPWQRVGHEEFWINK